MYIIKTHFSPLTKHEMDIKGKSLLSCFQPQLQKVTKFGIHIVLVLLIVYLLLGGVTQMKSAIFCDTNSTGSQVETSELVSNLRYDQINVNV